MWVTLISDTHGLPAPRLRPEPALAPSGAATATGGTGWAAAYTAKEHDSQQDVRQLQVEALMHSRDTTTMNYHTVEMSHTSWNSHSSSGPC